MRNSKVLCIVKKELKDMFRDRRTIIMSIIIPLVLVPAILMGTFYFTGQQVKKTETEPIAVAYQGAASVKNFLISQPLVEVKDLDAAQAVREKKVEVGLVGEELPSGVKVYLYFDMTNIKTQGKMDRVRGLLNLLDEQLAEQKVRDLGGEPTEVLHPVSVEDKDLTPPGGLFRFVLSTFLPFAVVVYGIAANAYLAADVGAGEKEKGTLEPLLSLPVSRGEIALGKALSLSALGFITVALMLLAILLVMSWGMPWIAPSIAPSEQINHQGTSLNLGVSFFLLVALAGLLLSLAAGSLSWVLSIYSRNIREAQLYISYLPLIVVIPLVAINAVALNSVESPLWSYFLPLVNVYSLTRDLLLASAKPILILWTLVSNLLFCVVALYLSSRILQQESVILRR